MHATLTNANPFPVEVRVGARQPRPQWKIRGKVKGLAPCATGSGRSNGTLKPTVLGEDRMGTAHRTRPSD